MLNFLSAKVCQVANDRIIESLELEGTFKDHLVQLPCNEQGHAQLDQVAQGLYIYIYLYIVSLDLGGI